MRNVSFRIDKNNHGNDLLNLNCYFISFGPLRWSHSKLLSVFWQIKNLLHVWQNKELIGDNGLLPLKRYLAKLSNHLYDKDAYFWTKFQESPTLFWLLEPWNNVDSALDICALSGLAISLAVFVTGAANSLALVVLWLFYLSLVNVGQQWYSCGWESQVSHD